MANPTGHTTTSTTTTTTTPAIEGVQVAAMEASLAELQGKFQQQYESLTNIISDMAEERNRLLLQTLDLQMKCDFQQSELQEQAAQVKKYLYYSSCNNNFILQFYCVHFCKYVYVCMYVCMYADI